MPTVLIISAIIIGSISVVHLLLWYSALALIKEPASHRRMWHTWRPNRQLTKEIAAAERVPAWLLRGALLTRTTMIAMTIAAVAIFVAGLVAAR